MLKSLPTTRRPSSGSTTAWRAATRYATAPSKLSHGVVLIVLGDKRWFVLSLPFVVVAVVDDAVVLRSW
jgi:hypothetical protein